MKSYRTLLAATSAVCFMAAAAVAAEATPTGTWKWSQPGRGGNAPTERTIRLELNDGKLSGTLMGYQGPQGLIPDNPITQTSYKDGAIAFAVEVSFGDTKYVIKYTGKLEGDTIKGAIERPGRDGGASTKTDWVATRY